MDLRELPSHAFVRHPWEMARADFFLRLLRDQLGRDSPACIHALDIGAGDGYLAKRLLSEVAGVASVTCFDTGYDLAWLEARRQDERGIDFTARWPEASFALVLLLDVLEHADDDEGLLAQAMAKTARPGWLLLSAPAHPRLFSHHDDLLGHRRRYAPATLRTLTVRAGLELVCAGQLFSSLLLPRALAKLGERMLSENSRPARDHVETPLGTWHHGPMVTSAARGLLALDGAASRWAAQRHLPLPGLSTWVLARRR